jgi:hypothetical protein
MAEGGGKVMDKEPENERIHCNVCNQNTVHCLLNREEVSDAEEDGYWWVTTSDTLQCCGCRAVVLRQAIKYCDHSPVNVSFFPPRTYRTLPPWLWKLPANITFLVREIYWSLAAEGLRLPVMGARALVDLILTEKVGDLGGFKQKMDAFEKEGFVSAKNRAVLDAVLDLGHAANHRGHAASAENVHAVMDIVENMLQAVYIFPAIEERLKDCTPQRNTNPKP